MPCVNAVPLLTTFCQNQKREKLVSARAAHQSTTTPHWKTSQKDDSSVKLTRNGEPYNLYLHLARNGHWQWKWIKISSSAADLHSRQKSLNGSLILNACFPSTQWPVSTATVVEMASLPSPSNWLVRFLSIKGQVSPVVKQDFSLIQNMLPCRKNFRAMANLTEASSIPNSIEANSGRIKADEFLQNNGAY